MFYKTVSIIWSINVLIFNTLAISQPKGSPMEPPPVPVLVAPVKTAQLREVIELVGSARAITETTICTETSGLVQELHVDEGDFVKKGEIICKLKDIDLILMRNEAKAELESLKQKLAELEAGTRKEDIERLQAMVKELKAVAEKWDREKKRVERLYKEKVASLKEYRDTISEWQAARARLHQVEAELDKAIAGPRKELIAQVRAEVLAQEARVDQIEDKIEKTSIKAPFSGFITAKRTEIGKWIQTGGPVVDMIDINIILARVNVPEKNITYIKQNDPANVWIDALNKNFVGKVVHIIPQGDPSARTFPIEIAIDNPKGIVKPGMFVRVKVPAGPLTPTLVVPKDAIIHRGSKTMIVLIRQGRAFPVAVKTGLEHLSKVAIKGTVKTGEPVVIRGNERLRPY